MIHTSLQMTDEEIDAEVRAINAAARKLRGDRKAALVFLRNIGAAGWPNSPLKTVPVSRAKNQNK